MVLLIEEVFHHLKSPPKWYFMEIMRLRVQAFPHQSTLGVPYIEDPKVGWSFGLRLDGDNDVLFRPN